MIITKETIEKKLMSGQKIGLFCIFGITGLLLPLLPVLTIRELNSNLVIAVLVLTVIFGIPFGVIIGLRNIIKIVSVRRKVSNGEFYIEVDTVTDLTTSFSVFAHDNESGGQVTLKSYSDRTNLNIIINKRDFDKLKIGDRFILIFVNKSKKPILFFPGNAYVVDRELVSKIRASGVDGYD